MLGALGLLDAQGDVGADFLDQSLPDMPGGDELAVNAGEWAIVNSKLHLDGRRVNRHKRQRRAVFRIRNGLTDKDVLKPGQTDDVPRVGLGDFNALEALEVEDGRDLGGALASVTVDADTSVAQIDFAAVDLAEGNATQVIRVIQVRGQQPEPLPGVCARRRDVLDNGVEQRLHRPADMFEVRLRVAVLGAGVNHREIHLLVRGMEREEEVPHFVEHPMRVSVLAVNLVDHDDRLGPGFERLAQDEARLRLRAIRRIHHQQHAVNHVHDALDLAAEVRVAGGVHNIDVVILVFERGVLGLDGDALLAFKVHRVHDALLGRDGLVGAKRPRLLEQAIHEGRLAVVNVGNNSDVAYVLHKKSAPNRVNIAANANPRDAAPSLRGCRYNLRSGIRGHNVPLPMKRSSLGNGPTGRARRQSLSTDVRA